jgi:mono/diheme cytochrome c family protein
LKWTAPVYVKRAVNPNKGECMNRISIVAIAVFLFAGAAVVAAEPVAKSTPKSKGSPAQVARGKYLVEQVAMCIDCHSPRDQKGEFIREKWLQGSALDFKNTVPMPKWAEVAPPIAGLPGWTAENGVTFLVTGKDPKGEMPDPPMPQYRMSKEDATAVVAYLKSLPPPGSK